MRERKFCDFSVSAFYLFIFIYLFPCCFHWNYNQESKIAPPDPDDGGMKSHEWEGDPNGTFMGAQWVIFTAWVRFISEFIGQNVTISAQNGILSYLECAA